MSEKELKQHTHTAQSNNRRKQQNCGFVCSCLDPNEWDRLVITEENRSERERKSVEEIHKMLATNKLADCDVCDSSSTNHLFYARTETYSIRVQTWFSIVWPRKQTINSLHLVFVEGESENRSCYSFEKGSFDCSQLCNKIVHPILCMKFHKHNVNAHNTRLVHRHMLTARWVSEWARGEIGRFTRFRFFHWPVCLS